MKRFPIPRELIVPKGATKVADKQSDAVAYLYVAKHNGKPAAMVFFGKQSKPIFRLWFPTELQRETKIAAAFAGRRARDASKAEYRAKRQAWVPTYKVGDIFRTCWGYDQTNIEYFEIIEIKGKHAVLRELQQERVETNSMQGTCVPLPGQYCEPRFKGDDSGVPIRRLMQEHGIKIDDVRTGRLAEGEMIGGVRVIKPAGWTSYA